MKNKPDIQQIAIEQLTRGKYQPRREFDPEALHELAESIKSAGLIQPIVVRPLRTGQYEIVAGERRWRAAQMAGLDSISCLINHYSDEQAAAVTTIENINRVDLNPIEEAKAYQRLIDEFRYLHEEVAAVVGKSRVKITNALRLLKLEPRVQEMLIKGEISEGHGKILAGLTLMTQLELAHLTIARGWSVRKLELECKKAQEQGTQYRQKDPNLRSLETTLSEHLGCKVDIDFSIADAKGQLKIDFHNLDILEGLLAKMGMKAKESQ